MYIPEPFREDDGDRLQAMIRQFPFASLVTCPVDEETAVAAAVVTHLPLLLDPQRRVLRGHMARSNPQWQHFRAGREVLAVFQGPHAMIPAHWYGDPEGSVPTWNYVAVHAYGMPRILEDREEAAALLRESLVVYQPEAPARSLDPSSGQLVRRIVAFELHITRLEGKWKLSQNRSPEDRRRVHDGLLERGQGSDRELAGMMREVGAVPNSGDSG